MRPGSSPGVQDSEKNTPGSNDVPLLRRLFARLFPRNDPPSVGVTPHFSENPAAETLPRKKSPYSEAESQQASAKLWAIYIDEAERYDKALVESWKADMEGMLIFSGLFSASVTAFLIESYPTLQSDSGDITVQLLTQISQQLSGNHSVVFPGAVAFQPTQSSLVCNALWFLSLSLALTCALLATLVEQWAREFLHKTYRRPSPIRRARVLSFLYFGVRRFGMHAVVDLIPMLLHISLIFFLAGLIAFLIPVNHVMMSLICMVLAVFLALYAILTLMPILALDSPYRTPFSYLLWNLIQSIRSRLSSRSKATPMPTTINDSIVAVALQTATSRDSRALKWTLESLTDDEQLLPFLEAIPDALHGAKGFHWDNSYLFISLLDSPSNPIHLGQRITNFLLGCRNMAAEDPLCQRRLAAGMKALWALGMGCTRIDSSSSVTEWIDDNVLNAVYPPKDWKGFWPRSYEQAAVLAVLYARMNNIRGLVKHLVHLAENGEHTQLRRGVRHILEHRDGIHIHGLPNAFYALLESLASWETADSHRISDVLGVLSSLQREEIWVETSVSLVTRYLVFAAENFISDGTIPHEMMQTCDIIVPTVSIVPDFQPMSRRDIIPTAPKVNFLFDPSSYKTPGADIVGLDRIMRCFLRLLPLIRQEEVAPIFAIYLARRNNLEVVEFVAKDGNNLKLLDALIAILQPQSQDINTLLAVQVIILLPRIAHHMEDWEDRDDRLWDYMVTNNIFNSPLFVILSAVMTHKNRLRVHVSASNLLKAVQSVDAERQTTIRDLRVLAADPMFSPPINDQLLCEDFQPEVLVKEVQTRAMEAMLLDLINLLSACLHPEKPSNMHNAIHAIVRCLPHTFGSVDIGIMTR